ncbi:MAG: segregation/condensation protein A [Planctomycetes bacterium]|nr:segregation/condensation protein A [Planctomycetota bacterium]
MTVEATSSDRADLAEGESVDIGYTVSLASFSGPLDLLLYLVRRAEVDIVDIPIALIAEQFIDTIGQWQDLDLDIAGEFILMAATLLEIKARLVAPPLIGAEAEEDGDEEIIDLRTGLIGKLLAYRHFKEAGLVLGARGDEHALHHIRQLREDIPEDPTEAEGIDLENADPYALASAWEDVLKRINGLGPRTVINDSAPLEVRISSVLDALRANGSAKLSWLFAAEPSLLGQVTTVMAVLECARQRFLEAQQFEQYGEVDLRFRPENERTITRTEFPPEEPVRRRRRPALCTWQPHPDAVLGSDEIEGDEEPQETDEQRFMRELEETCAVDSVLSRTADIEKSFAAFWAERRGEPPPGTVVVEATTSVPAATATPVAVVAVPSDTVAAPVDVPEPAIAVVATAPASDAEAMRADAPVVMAPVAAQPTADTPADSAPAAVISDDQPARDANAAVDNTATQPSADPVGAEVLAAPTTTDQVSDASVLTLPDADAIAAAIAAEPAHIVSAVQSDADVALALPPATSLEPVTSAPPPTEVASEPVEPLASAPSSTEVANEPSDGPPSAAFAVASPASVQISVIVDTVEEVEPIEEVTAAPAPMIAADTDADANLESITAPSEPEPAPPAPPIAVALDPEPTKPAPTLVPAQSGADLAGSSPPQPLPAPIEPPAASRLASPAIVIASPSAIRHPPSAPSPPAPVILDAPANPLYSTHLSRAPLRSETAPTESGGDRIHSTSAPPRSSHRTLTLCLTLAAIAAGTAVLWYTRASTATPALRSDATTAPQSPTAQPDATLVPIVATAAFIDPDAIARWTQRVDRARSSGDVVAWCAAVFGDAELPVTAPAAVTADPLAAPEVLVRSSTIDPPPTNTTTTADAEAEAEAPARGALTAWSQAIRETGDLYGYAFALGGAEAPPFMLTADAPTPTENPTRVEPAVVTDPTASSPAPAPAPAATETIPEDVIVLPAFRFQQEAMMSAPAWAILWAWDDAEQPPAP